MHKYISSTYAQVVFKKTWHFNAKNSSISVLIRSSPVGFKFLKFPALGSVKFRHQSRSDITLRQSYINIYCYSNFQSRFSLLLFKERNGNLLNHKN